MFRYRTCAFCISETFITLRKRCLLRWPFSNYVPGTRRWGCASSFSLSRCSRGVSDSSLWHWVLVFFFWTRPQLLLNLALIGTGLSWQRRSAVAGNFSWYTLSCRRSPVHILKWQAGFEFVIIQARKVVSWLMAFLCMLVMMTRSVRVYCALLSTESLEWKYKQVLRACRKNGEDLLLVPVFYFRNYVTYFEEISCFEIFAESCWGNLILICVGSAQLFYTKFRSKSKISSKRLVLQRYCGHSYRKM